MEPWISRRIASDLGNLLFFSEFFLLQPGLRCDSQPIPLVLRWLSFGSPHPLKGGSAILGPVSLESCKSLPISTNPFLINRGYESGEEQNKHGLTVLW